MKRKKNLNRREVLSTLGIVPVLGISSSLSKEKSKNKIDALTAPTFITRSDKLEYARLRILDLNDPKILAKQKKMPVCKIGNLKLGRIICGSNLISMNMHARDLYYVRDLAANYNTEERIFMTLKRCEEYGINSIVLKTIISSSTDCQIIGASGAEK